MNDMIAYPGPKTLVLDPSFTSNIDISEPGFSGEWNLPNTHLTTLTNNNVGPSLTVTVSNGTRLLNLDKISGSMTLVNNNAGLHALAWSSLTSKPIIIEGALQFESSNGGPVMLNTAVETELWFKGTSYLRTNFGPVLSHQNSGGTLRVFFDEQSRVDPGVLEGNLGGTWDVRIASPSVQYNFSQPAITDPSYNPIYTYPIGGLTHITPVIVSSSVAQFFDTVRLNTSVGAYNVLLPDASLQPGGFVEFKGVVPGADNILIAGVFGQTIDGNPSVTITGSNFLRVRSDGSNWIVV
jgi:hypothetical protein